MQNHFLGTQDILISGDPHFTQNCLKSIFWGVTKGRTLFSSGLAKADMNKADKASNIPEDALLHSPQVHKWWRRDTQKLDQHLGFGVLSMMVSSKHIAGSFLNSRKDG